MVTRVRMSQHARISCGQVAAGTTACLGHLGPEVASLDWPSPRPRSPPSPLLALQVAAGDGSHHSNGGPLARATDTSGCQGPTRMDGHKGQAQGPLIKIARTREMTGTR